MLDNHNRRYKYFECKVDNLEFYIFKLRKSTISPKVKEKRLQKSSKALNASDT